MEIVSFKSFKSNLKYCFKKVENNTVSIVIKRKNKENLVLISLKEYNSLKETMYLLSGKNGKVLLNSIKEFDNNKCFIRKLVE